MDSQKTSELIKILTELRPDTINGAVIFHINKTTKQVESISPVIPVGSLQELYNNLRDCRNAITAFLNDLVDKNLAKN